MIIVYEAASIEPADYQPPEIMTVTSCWFDIYLQRLRLVLLYLDIVLCLLLLVVLGEHSHPDWHRLHVLAVDLFHDSEDSFGPCSSTFLRLHIVW